MKTGERSDVTRDITHGFRTKQTSRTASPRSLIVIAAKR
jgi:hypothetical protein